MFAMCLSSTQWVIIVKFIGGSWGSLYAILGCQIISQVTSRAAGEIHFIILFSNCCDDCWLGLNYNQFLLSLLYCLLHDWDNRFKGCNFVTEFILGLFFMMLLMTENEKQRGNVMRQLVSHIFRFSVLSFAFLNLVLLIMDFNVFGLSLVQLSNGIWNILRCA